MSPPSLLPALPRRLAAAAVLALFAVLSAWLLFSQPGRAEGTPTVAVSAAPSSSSVGVGDTFQWVVTIDIQGPDPMETGGALLVQADLYLPDALTHDPPDFSGWDRSCGLSSPADYDCEVWALLDPDVPGAVYEIPITALVPRNPDVCGSHELFVKYAWIYWEGETEEPTAGGGGTATATVTVQCKTVANEGRVLVGKVIPGFPGDTATFAAVLTPCSEQEGPAGPAIGVPFSQPAPGSVRLPAGCWEISEHITLPGYSLLGWAWAKHDPQGNVYCPTREQSDEQPVRFTLEADQVVAICFFNNRKDTTPIDPPDRGAITVAKVVVGDPSDDTEFTAEVWGAASEPELLGFTQQRPGQSSSLSAGSYKVVEQARPGYRILGWAYGKPSRLGDTCPGEPAFEGNTAPVTLAAVDVTAEAQPGTGEHVAVCFYNERLDDRDDPVDIDPEDPLDPEEPEIPDVIVVEKTESVLGIERPGVGWQFTVSGCGIEPRTAATGAGGSVKFAVPHVPGCSYTVTETLQSGWVAVTPSQPASPRKAGDVVTLTFVNIREWNPPCMVGCYELPIEPPPAPPASPQPPAQQANPPAAPPAPSPAPQTPAPAPAEPAPPGASSATGAPPAPAASLGVPLPPNTGTGAGRESAFAGLLSAAAIAVLSLSAGLTLIAVARRR
ncbi:MAG: hypothetical protein KatS3mg064_1258 [Tepidiforma sp.]|nr:hypothetical protein [Tepidiforma sp.]GIW18101.1 MAG: hypothetical protein KatS3mg064_1258 [Tepidiforma sp.]